MGLRCAGCSRRLACYGLPLRPLKWGGPPLDAPVVAARAPLDERGRAGQTSGGSGAGSEKA